jgi:subtilisin family serine protease
MATKVSTRALRRVLTGALTGVIVFSGALSASAAGDDEGGLWYYNDYGVADAVAAGASGAGVKVAVIDSVIDTDVPNLAGADITVREPSYCATLEDPNTAEPATSTDYASANHGTDMVSVIVGNGTGPGRAAGQLGTAPKASILYYATNYSSIDGTGDPFDSDILCPTMGAADDTQDDGLTAAFAASINQAIDDGADIITIATGFGASPDLYAAVARAVREGVVVVAARSNTDVPDTDERISGMNGVVTVQAMDPAGNLQKESAVADPATDVVGPGVSILGSVDSFDTVGPVDGTSPATNIVAGYLADVKSKYPAATGNQLIQTLVRNTGRHDHDFVKDPANFTGYGAVSLRHMLDVDPTTYDDVNPLVSKGVSQQPYYDEIYGAVLTASATAEPSAVTNPLTAIVPVIVIGGIVVLLIVIAAIVVVIVLVRRSRRSAPPSA